MFIHSRATDAGALAGSPAAPPRPSFEWLTKTAPLSLALLTVGARLAVGPLIIDDAFITFRYARNIAAGIGFVYNPGERVLGTTTPLYTQLLAGLHVGLGTDLPHLSLWVAALADAATTVLLFWLATRLGLRTRWAAMASALFALSPFSVTYAVSGMESSLFSLLVFGAAAASASGRPRSAAFSAGLATLARPEGILIGALVFGRYLAFRRLPPLSIVLLYLAPVLPWIAFASLWFGSPLPQSVVAKALIYRLDPMLNALALIRRPDISGLIVVPAALPLISDAVRYLKRQPDLWLLVGSSPLLIVFYALSGLKGALLFPWYLVPLVPFYLLGAVAVFQLSSAKTSRLPQKLGSVALLAMLAIGLSLDYISGSSLLNNRNMVSAREQAYLEAGQFLMPRIGPRTVVALPEIGAFGYETGARILDTAGLVSPQATHFYPLPPGFDATNAIPPELIKEAKPGFIVGLDEFFQTSLIEADWFRQDYHLLTSFEARIWHSRSVVVYERSE